MTQGHHMTQGRPVRVRFAPSPTGLLHAGNARVALVNWLFARREGGRFILRLDDTDAERSTPEFAAAIEEDLLWLGLRWDEMVRQSDRTDHYREAFEALHAGGRLYPCYETPEELALARKRHRAAGAPPVYDRAALRLTAAAREALEAQGRRPHWRFLLEDRKVAWDDLVHGRLSFAAGSLSDPVLFRSDGRPLYTVTSAVDDIALEITHVIRGDDHIANSAAQAQLFEALGAPVPAFGHLPLLMDAGGGSLSKRLGSLSLRALRDDGIEPMAVNSLLATLGTSAPVAAHRSLSDLMAAFDFAKISRAGPRFDPEELRHLNAKLLHEMPFEAVRGRLAALGLADADARFWCAVRPNLARLDEAAEWWQVCFGKVRPVIRDAHLTATAAALLPEGAWDESTWPAWTKAVAAATGAKGRNLFLPLRLALTGRDHGPELKTLLPMIGRARAQARLTGKTA